MGAESTGRIPNGGYLNIENMDMRNKFVVGQSVSVSDYSASVRKGIVVSVTRFLVTVSILVGAERKWCESFTKYDAVSGLVKGGCL